MFNFELNSWGTSLHGYYILTVAISLLVIVVTLVISRQFNFSKVLVQEIEHARYSEETNAEDTKIAANTTDVSNANMKRSPALVAEKVIQANMTEEQKLLEYQVRQQQLAQIYELMLKQSDKFGSISLSEVEEQMKLYQ